MPLMPSRALHNLHAACLPSTLHNKPASAFACLGVDAAAHTAEQSDGGATQTVASDGLRAVVEQGQGGACYSCALARGA